MLFNNQKIGGLSTLVVHVADFTLSQPEASVFTSISLDFR